MSASKPHSELVAKAWSRIDTTKTEDMVPSSELRGWLAEYVSLFEQYQALREAALRVMDADNMSLGAPGNEGIRAMREMEDALENLGAVVNSNPATSSERSSAAETAVAGDDPADRSEASSPASRHDA